MVNFVCIVRKTNVRKFSKFYDCDMMKIPIYIEDNEHYLIVYPSHSLLYSN